MILTSHWDNLENMIIDQNEALFLTEKKCISFAFFVTMKLGAINHVSKYQRYSALSKPVWQRISQAGKKPDLGNRQRISWGRQA